MTSLALRREEVLAWLQERVPPPRLRHILGVEAMARQLAAHYGLDEEKAAWAGLMHDLAKSFPAEQLLQRVARERELDEIERLSPTSSTPRWAPCWRGNSFRCRMRRSWRPSPTTP
jgi:HD superfamily phosphohydrolase YqeK